MHSSRTLFPSIFPTLAIAVMFLPAALVAQSAPDPPESSGPHGQAPETGAFYLDRMAETLDLSEAQILEIGGLLSSHRVETTELRTEALAARNAARDLAEREVFDEDAIRAAEERVAAAHVELAVERARLKSAIHAVLTPEQAEKAAALKLQRRDRRAELGGHRERRQPRRPAPGGRRW